MSVITEADKVCGSPSDAQKHATQQMEDCEVGKESDQWMFEEVTHSQSLQQASVKLLREIVSDVGHH
jgi:hypothetical protein